MTYLSTHRVQASYEKLLAEVPKYKMITPSVLADRLRVSPAASFSRCYRFDGPVLGYPYSYRI